MSLHPKIILGSNEEDDIFSSINEFDDIDTCTMTSPMKLEFPKLVSPAKDLCSPSRFFRSPVRIKCRKASPARNTIKSPCGILDPGRFPPTTPPIRIKSSISIGTERSPLQLLNTKMEQESGTDSFLSFVRTLSPLVEFKNDETKSPEAFSLSNSTTRVRSSVTKLMPPFTTQRFVSKTGYCRPQSKQHDNVRRVAQRLDFRDENRCNRNYGLIELDPYLPRIQASTTETPGKSQRSFSETKVMRYKISAPGNFNNSKELKKINENLKSPTPIKNLVSKFQNSLDKKSNQSPLHYINKNTKTPQKIGINVSSISKFNNTPTILKTPNQRKKIISTPISNLKQRFTNAQSRLVASAPHISMTERRRIFSSSFSINRSTPLSSIKNSSPYTLHGKYIRNRQLTNIGYKTSLSKFRERALKITPTPEQSQNRNPCNCKKSKCLKLYCECFAAGGYCSESCKCVNCANTLDDEKERTKAINQILLRNPNAFKPKIHRSKMISEKQSISRPIHHTGCHCKKSACLKKYCECYQAGVTCGENCKCTECKNFPGSGILSDSTAMSDASLTSPLYSSSSSSVYTPIKKSSYNSYVSSSSTSTSYSKFLQLKRLSDRKKRERENLITPKGHESLLKKQCLEPSKYKTLMKSYSKNFGSSKPVPLIEMFGFTKPPIKKGISIEILKYLDNDDLYNASLVNHIWTCLALDTELWDYTDVIQM